MLGVAADIFLAAAWAQTNVVIRLIVEVNANKARSVVFMSLEDP
jgi:hypothetical protein